MLWLWSQLAHGSCPLVPEAVDEAFAAMLDLLDYDAAARLLEEAERGLACGPVQPPEVLARRWLAHAALDAALGRHDEADVRLAAARRASPDTWDDDLGPVLRARWEEAEVPGAPGFLSAEPLPPVPVWVDGMEVQLPFSVAPGLHVLQLAQEGGVLEGIELFALGGEVVTVDLPEVKPPPKEVRPIIYLWRDRRVFLHVAAGAGVAVGPRADYPAVDAVESSFKPIVPLELGLSFASGRAWGRLHGTSQSLLTGTYVYAATEQTYGVTRGSVGGAVDGGYGAIGGSIGALAPGRLALRGIYRADIANQLWLDIRPGLNVLTGGRPPEPQLDVVWVVAI